MWSNETTCWDMNKMANIFSDISIYIFSKFEEKSYIILNQISWKFVSKHLHINCLFLGFTAFQQVKTSNVGLRQN